jgi:hypothetical protein
MLDLRYQANEVSLLKQNLKIGIVIQGPIFPGITFETCKYYKKVYPAADIVLSTWEGENTSEFKALCDSKFKVIQSIKPYSSGQQNINLQIASSAAGIKHLNSQSCTHILKTRTDILLGNRSFLNYLVWMHSKGKQNALVFSSFNSFLFRLFSPSDQVMFGEAKAIARFWSIDLVRDGEEIDFPEKYLFKKYLESNGYETREELTSYLIALRDYTVIADHDQLGQIWNKGAYTALSARWRGEKFPNRWTELTSWYWEMLQDDLTYFEKLNNSLG